MKVKKAAMRPWPLFQKNLLYVAKWPLGYPLRAAFAAERKLIMPKAGVKLICIICVHSCKGVRFYIKSNKGHIFGIKMLH